MKTLHLTPLKMVAGMATFVLSVVLLWIVIEFIVLRGETPPITNETGETIKGSIASLERINLRGVAQYVLIHGADSTKPLVLFLHGSPGMPAMYLAHAFQRDLENHFVIVQWDRPGSGKSYSAGILPDSLTLRQTLEDLFELTRHLLDRFQKNCLILVAHSWGTLLGLLAVREHPEYFAAYVGMGQLSADSLRRYVVQRRFLFNMARTHGDEELVTWSFRGGTVREDDIFRYGGGSRGTTSFLPILLTSLRSPEYDLFDAIHVSRGSSLVFRRMRMDVGNRDFDRDLVTFQIPIYFFLGRYDYITPSVLASEYFEVLEAPLKELIWFESSAHFPFWEEQRKFTSEMLRLSERISPCF